jgi:phage antirepressor YoqD-like protein
MKNFFIFSFNYIMPYQIKKLDNGRFRVKNAKTGEVKAKNTTKLRAQNQVKLLNYLEGKGILKS